MKEIGSEFSLYSETDYYFSHIKSFGKSVRFLRCGRDAIGYVANLLTRNTGIILMPAYCCDSMVNPFEIRGWKIVYYTINEDLSIDVQYLISAYDKYHPDVVLLMNFFGITDTSKSVNTIRDKCPGIQIIEDITHSLLDLDKIYSNQVDYYVGSIRKWFGIVDGALVIATKNDTPEIDYFESDFVTLRRQGLSLKEEYIHTNSTETKKTFRKVLLDAEKSLNNGSNPCSISPDSQSILENMNVETLRNSRKINTKVLFGLLKTIPEISFPKKIDNILEITPFSIPILINNRDSVQKKMTKRGVYASLLWPLSEDARNISPIALEMENTMLSIPIDQRYDASDMQTIYKVIKNSLTK